MLLTSAWQRCTDAELQLVLLLVMSSTPSRPPTAATRRCPTCSCSGRHSRLAAAHVTAQPTCLPTLTPTAGGERAHHVSSSPLWQQQRVSTCYLVCMLNLHVMGLTTPLGRLHACGSAPKGQDPTAPELVYMTVSCRPSLEAMLEEYWRLMPQYQATDLDALEPMRILFGFFPTYRQAWHAPAALPWHRLLGSTTTERQRCRMSVALWSCGDSESTQCP